MQQSNNSEWTAYLCSNWHELSKLSEVELVAREIKFLQDLVSKPRILVPVTEAYKKLYPNKKIHSVAYYLARQKEVEAALKDYNLQAAKMFWPNTPDVEMATPVTEWPSYGTSNWYFNDV